MSIQTVVEEIKNQINTIVGQNPIESESYVRIINQKQVGILKKTFWLEPPIKYPPYSNFKLKLIRAFLG